MFRQCSIPEKSVCASVTKTPSSKAAKAAAPIRNGVFTRRDVLLRVPLLFGRGLGQEQALLSSQLPWSSPLLLSSQRPLSLPPRPQPLSFLLPLLQPLSPEQHLLRPLPSDGCRDSKYSISPARSYPSGAHRTAPAGSVHRPCPS